MRQRRTLQRCPRLTAGSCEGGVVASHAGAPPWPLGSGPAACRALGVAQRRTDTQTQVLTLHGYCRTEGEERLKKLSEKGKKEKQY